VIIVDEEDNSNRRNTTKSFDIFDSQQKAMSSPALPDVGITRSLELLGLFNNYGAIRCDSYGLVARL
jgi:hypothetical protein